ncbi:hypothetical protein LJ656_06935 [Paraburkholderia sp. MMS20-SJTR3]|uniref:Uncharacterized protein n=1 Tax=Paraburkholderia sejongensis TaxID=2886946 RepID=A0ABS8JRE7_9BURK|nr:hypothetical protein [Paraburkholderia sp. MMS20-SJTR3]MCC8392319.1 hypothetical protein [Paraburkholderia sp. MMS20-SJTR3]
MRLIHGLMTFPDKWTCEERLKMNTTQLSFQDTGYLIVADRLRSSIVGGELLDRFKIRDEILFLIDVVDAQKSSSLIVQSALNVARSHAVLGRPLRALSRLETVLTEHR